MTRILPNVDAAVMPDLAAYIERYAERHEYRIDGSSLWEGRVRYEDDDITEAAHLAAESVARGIMPEDHPLTRFYQHYLAYPVFEVLAGFELFAEDEGACFYRHDAYRAVVCVEGRVLYIAHHPRDSFGGESPVRYENELEGIREDLALGCGRGIMAESGTR